MRFSRNNSSQSVRVEIQPGVWLDSRLALWLATERLLVVADLHWGYAASHRARGNLVPLWGDDEIEQRLNALIADYAPAEMIWLGDTVHAAEGGDRADEFLRKSRLRLPVTLVAGNHDRRWAGAAEALRFVQRGRFILHHGDQPLPGAQPPTAASAAMARVACPCCGMGVSPWLAIPDAIEIIGHHHPAANCGTGAGPTIKVPALIATAQQLILPAFSPWAAGTAWPARAGMTIWAIAPKRIFALPRVQTSGPSLVGSIDAAAMPTTSLPLPRPA